MNLKSSLSLTWLKSRIFFLFINIWIFNFKLTFVILFTSTRAHSQSLGLLKCLEMSTVWYSQKSLYIQSITQWNHIKRLHPNTSLTELFTKNIKLLAKFLSLESILTVIFLKVTKFKYNLDSIYFHFHFHFENIISFFLHGFHF